MMLISKMPDHAGKNTLAEPYRSIASALCSRHGLEAEPEEILFLIDSETRTLRPSGSTIMRIPQMWREVICQLTGVDLKYIIKFFAANLDMLTPAQATALLYHELRHIRRDPETGETYFQPEHDCEDWAELVSYGNWEEPGAELPNLMEGPVPTVRLLPAREATA